MAPPSSPAIKAKKNKVVVSPYFKSGESAKSISKLQLKTTTFQMKKEPQDTDQLAPVPDMLDYNLRVLFVGINAGITSSKRGHHFASPSNHFWPCLSASGLVDRKVTYEDDVHLPRSHGIGFTNLTAKVSRRASDLTTAEQLNNAPCLTAKIMEYHPKWVVFIGMGMYQIYSGQKRVNIGLQDITIPWKDNNGSSRVYVMPSTSGLVAAYHKKDKIKYFVELGRLLSADNT